MTSLELARGIADLRQMVQYAVEGRCMACGWNLAPSVEEGCVQGNCSFRPHEEGPEYPGWHRRQLLVSEAWTDIRAQKPAR